LGNWRSWLKTKIFDSCKGKERFQMGGRWGASKEGGDGRGKKDTSGGRENSLFVLNRGFQEKGGWVTTEPHGEEKT